MTNYDKYYQTENLFGEPYPELLAFFKQYEPKGKLIDVGCGQGRNALPLARLGYQVFGIDTSKLGLDQINSKSKQLGLGVKAWLDDMYSFNDYSDYHIVLLDSMFHFNKKDKQREVDLIKKISRSISKNAVICFCIQDSGEKVRTLKEAVATAGIEVEILNDSSLIYKYEDKNSGHISESKYCLYIIKKLALYAGM
jgi:2-polyprenyl-3-methyl-5-hydroxy-6-metoxy-1,4-benzoquinol methylase